MMLDSSPARVRLSTFLVLAVLANAVPAAAQIDGHISAMVNLFPDPDPTPGRQEVTELRTRIFLEHQSDVGSWFRIHLSGYADGLVRRGCCSSPMRTAAIARPSDAYIEFRGSWFDFRAGASRIVWGRLDEFQPTDVVNPIDLSRFLLEGRSEARLPVGVLRARLHFGSAATLEVIGVPVFRASRFDQLDEPTSPFNLATVPAGVVIERHEPEFRRENFQGGGRLTATTARVDWGLSAYRGIRTFPTVTLLQTVAAPTTLLETFPYFTMVGADFETVRGPWGVRGEAAYFVDDTIQAPSGNPRGIEGRSAEGGVGIDRRAGDYRVAGNVLVSWNTLSDPEVSVVAAADRSFSRETRTLRAFAIYNTADRTLFGRVIAAVSLRDNLWLEGSGGLFTGSSLDPLGRLTRRDFFYTRLKLFL
jgi:hypothetical protein